MNVAGAKSILLRSRPVTLRVRIVKEKSGRSEEAFNASVKIGVGSGADKTHPHPSSAGGVAGVLLSDLSWQQQGHWLMSRAAWPNNTCAPIRTMKAAVKILIVNILPICCAVSLGTPPLYHSDNLIASSISMSDNHLSFTLVRESVAAAAKIKNVGGAHMRFLHVCATQRNRVANLGFQVYAMEGCGERTIQKK